MHPHHRPEVRHAYENHHLDAGRWRRFQVRPGDVVISTSYKAGTTWMQHIVGHLIFHEEGPPGPIQELSPWLDMRLFPEAEVTERLAGQQHRRFIKTHLPLDGLVYHDEVKYIVVCRDARDVFMSLLNHHGNHTDAFFEAMNSLPGRKGAEFPRMKADPREVWRDWMTRGWFDWESDGYPYWSHLHHCKTWWEFRHLPNIRLVHYSDLLRNLEGGMRSIADYLDISVPEQAWPRLVEACTFAAMKREATNAEPGRVDFVWKGGAETFFHKGTNGRWKDLLSEADLQLYQQAMARTLPADCARWMEQGGPVPDGAA